MKLNNVNDDKQKLLSNNDTPATKKKIVKTLGKISIKK
jgi:hypothetical protein